MSTPKHYPTCPQCGSRDFRMYVQQRIHVEFAEDDYQVYDGPEGDMEFDDATEAICNGCNYCAPLGEMK